MCQCGDGRIYLAPSGLVSPSLRAMKGPSVIRLPFLNTEITEEAAIRGFPSGDPKKWLSGLVVN